MVSLHFWVDLTGSIDVDVWPSHRNNTIDLESLFWFTFCCDVDIHGRKHCTSCNLQINRLNVKYFVKTLKFMIGVRNQRHTTGT